MICNHTKYLDISTITCISIFSEHAVYTQPDQYQHYSQPTPTDFQTVDATAAFHQDAPAPIPMPNDPAAHQFQSQSPANEMFSQNTQEPDQANQEDGMCSL